MLFNFTFVLAALAAVSHARPGAAPSVIPPGDTSDKYLGTKVGTVSTKTDVDRLALSEFRITQFFRKTEEELFVVDLETHEYWEVVEPYKTEFTIGSVAPIEENAPAPNMAPASFGVEFADPDYDALWAQSVANRDAERRKSQSEDGHSPAVGSADNSFHERRGCQRYLCFGDGNCRGCSCQLSFTSFGGLYGTCG